MCDAAVVYVTVKVHKSTADKNLVCLSNQAGRHSEPTQARVNRQTNWRPCDHGAAVAWWLDEDFLPLHKSRWYSYDSGDSKNTRSLISKAFKACCSSIFVPSLLVV